MVTLHFHLLPQYKYELFHIYFTSFHCTGRYKLNKLTLLPMCGFIAQLVEHRAGIAEVMGSNAVEALIFFRLLLSNCLNWKIYCDGHTSLARVVFERTHSYLRVLPACSRIARTNVKVRKTRLLSLVQLRAQEQVFNSFTRRVSDNTELLRFNSLRWPEPSLLSKRAFTKLHVSVV